MAVIPKPSSLGSPRQSRPLHEDRDIVAWMSSHMKFSLCADVVWFLGWMNAELGRRQREDEPSATGIDVLEPEHVAKHRAKSVGPESCTARHERR